MVAIPFVEITDDEIIVESTFRCPRKTPEKSYGIITDKSYWSVTVCHADSFYIHNRQKNRTWYFRVVDGKAKHVSFSEDVKAECWDIVSIMVSPFFCLWELIKVNALLLGKTLNLAGSVLLMAPIALFAIMLAGMLVSSCAQNKPTEKITPNIMYPGFILNDGQRMQVTEIRDIALNDCRVYAMTFTRTYLTPKVTEHCGKGWYLKFRVDGNLVLCDESGNPRWASNTGGKGYTKAWVDVKENKFSFA